MDQHREYLDVWRAASDSKKRVEDYGTKLLVYGAGVIGCELVQVDSPVEKEDAFGFMTAGGSLAWKRRKTGYVEMFFVNLGDFFDLDWFFRGIVKKKGLMIRGTEHCEAWNLKKWMLTLGVPEHCIMWPLSVCPLTGLICAGIGALI